MSKCVEGRNNAAFIGDHGEKGPPTVQDKVQYNLELTEKGKLAQEEEEEYEPYHNREVDHPTSNSDTLFHLLKGSLGTGILAMPNAFKNAGYVTGSVGTVLIGILCTYCMQLLVKAEYELCKRKRVASMNYPTVGVTALNEGPKWCKLLSPYIANMINVFLLIYQLGICCVYVVFVASNIKAIADYYMEDKYDIRLYMLIILIPFILVNWVKNLKFLAPLSTFANGVTLVSFGIILYYIFRTPITTEGKDMFGDVHNFPLFFGTVLFALEAIGVILPLENEMKTPKAFSGWCGVLNVAMILIVILYLGMGLFGYLNYGHLTKGSITLNLEEGEILAQCVKGMLAFAIFITHSLACYVAIDITWNDYVTKKFTSLSNPLFWEYVVRTLLVVATSLLAIAIPNLELFISLFGALCLSGLGVAFPALFHISMYWYKLKGLRKFWLIFNNGIIIVIGFFALIVGTYTSLSEIIITYFKD